MSKGDINSDNSSSNESVHTTEVPEPIGEHLARAAGLKTRMPVYLQTAAALLKPFLLALVLGPQRPGKKEPWHKPLQILILTVAPFVASFIADFRMTFHMWFFIDEEVKPTFRLLGTLMVIGNSPNLGVSRSFKFEVECGVSYKTVGGIGEWQEHVLTDPPPCQRPFVRKVHFTILYPLYSSHS